jgi:ABC-type multidrug transport system ATPase subunit
LKIDPLLQEIFYPNLTVKQTMDFATTLKSPATLPQGFRNHNEHRKLIADFLLRSVGITHTAQTKV